MAHKDDLKNAGGRKLPPKTRNIPAATELPLSEEPAPAAVIKEKKTVENKVTKEKKTEVAPKKVEQPKVITPSEPEIKRGPGKPKKRKAGDKQISFWLDEDLVAGLFDNLKYGESAAQLINDAVREYQKKHKTYNK